MANDTMPARAKRVKDESNEAAAKRSGSWEQFGDRVRFNWGFWDARSDRAAGKPRQLLVTGAQCPLTVSREFDAAYHDGYVGGLASSEAPVTSSESAWLARPQVTA